MVTTLPPLRVITRVRWPALSAEGTCAEPGATVSPREPSVVLARPRNLCAAELAASVIFAFYRRTPNRVRIWRPMSGAMR